MAVVYNPFTGQFVLVPSTIGAGSETIKYSAAFTTTSWTLSGDYYVVTILSSEHGVENATASVYELVGTDLEQVHCTIIKNTSNDILIKVPSVPDNRFNGIVTII